MGFVHLPCFKVGLGLRLFSSRTVLGYRPSSEVGVRLHLYCIVESSSLRYFLLLLEFVHRCCCVVGYVHHLVSLMTALDFRQPILMTVLGGRHYYLVTDF